METIKRPKGRPKGRRPVHCVNYHCDAEIYDWLCLNRGEKSVTQFINSIIRKEAGL